MGNIFRFLLIGLLVILESSFLGCTHLAFQPSRQLFYMPEQVNAQAQSIFFSSEDSTRLHAWHFSGGLNSGKPSKAMVVFFHGNAENLTSHFLALSWLQKEQIDFLIFDYRGYGASAGEPELKGAVADGRAAIQQAHFLEPNLPIILLGQSLGGYLLLHTFQSFSAQQVTELNIKALVLDSTFDSLPDTASELLGKHFITLPLKWLSPLVLEKPNQNLSTHEKLAHLPKLVIHGTADPVVDFTLGQRLFEHLPEPKTFWPLEGGTHIDSFSRENGKFQKPFLKWLKHVKAISY